MQDLLAAIGLIDDDGLRRDLFRDDGLIGYHGVVHENPAEGEATTRWRVDERWGDEVAEQALLPHLLAAHVEAAYGADGLAITAAPDDEFAVADEEGIRRAGGVEGRELVDLAGVGVEVEGVVLMALIDCVEIACDRDGRSPDGSRSCDTCVFGFDRSAGLDGWMETIEVDLNDGMFRSRFDGRRAEEGGLRFRRRGRAFDGFHSEQVGIGGQDDGGDAAIFGGEKWPLSKSIARGEVGEGSEGGEGIA